MCARKRMKKMIITRADSGWRGRNSITMLLARIRSFTIPPTKTSVSGPMIHILRSTFRHHSHPTYRILTIYLRSHGDNDSYGYDASHVFVNVPTTRGVYFTLKDVDDFHLRDMAPTDYHISLFLFV